MDTQSLIREAKVRFQHQESKNYLKEKYTAELNFTDQGGLWTADLTLLSFLRTLPHKKTILLDNYGKPVEVVVSELLTVAQDVYDNTMKNWYEEFQELKNKR
jgi:hypothetical protein